MSEHEEKHPNNVPVLDGIVTKINDALADLPIDHRLEAARKVLEAMREDIKKQLSEAQNNYQLAQKQDEAFRTLIDTFTKNLSV